MIANMIEKHQLCIYGLFEGESIPSFKHRTILPARLLHIFEVIQPAVFVHILSTHTQYLNAFFLLFLSLTYSVNTKYLERFYVPRIFSLTLFEVSFPLL